MVRAWYMDDSNDDQRLEHNLNPPKFLDLETLNYDTGVEYFKVSLFIQGICFCNLTFELP